LSTFHFNLAGIARLAIRRPESDNLFPGTFEQRAQPGRTALAVLDVMRSRDRDRAMSQQLLGGDVGVLLRVREADTVGQVFPGIELCVICSTRARARLRGRSQEKGVSAARER